PEILFGDCVGHTDLVRRIAHRNHSVRHLCVRRSQRSDAAASPLWGELPGATRVPGRARAAAPVAGRCYERTAIGRKTLVLWACWWFRLEGKTLRQSLPPCGAP